mgnify:CR=1 FL=1
MPCCGLPLIIYSVFIVPLPMSAIRLTPFSVVAKPAILEAVKAKSNVLEDCIITGYCADCVEKYAHMNQDEFGRVLTASGQWVYPGSCVATDPDVIPTGSTVIIGDKTYIALDVGVIGKHVDILMTHEEAAVAGVRRETVWWCEE